jgi:hypothetical protein
MTAGIGRRVVSEVTCEPFKSSRAVGSRGNAGLLR